MQHCYKTSWTAMLRVLAPTSSNLSCNKPGCFNNLVSTRVVKRATSLFQFGRFATTSCTFLLPVVLTWDQALFSFRSVNNIPVGKAGLRKRECMRTAKIGPDLRLPYRSFRQQPRPQGFSLKKYFKGKALGTRLFRQDKQDKTFITLILWLAIAWHAVSLKASRGLLKSTNITWWQVACSRLRDSRVCGEEGRTRK